MKFLHEYRQREAVEKIAAEIHRVVTRPWTIMEVCGGQTHAIVKFGLQQLLPPQIELVHGPGCPVCVTSLEIIDQAIAIASRPDVIFCSFGDMLRVPGSNGDLLTVKAAGGDIRTVYSPLQALKVAEDNPHKEVVFFAIGFETTAPAHAMAVVLATKKRLRNFSLLVSHFLVPPAIEAICSAPGSRVQGFLAAGHVCAIMGYEQYRPLAREYRVPIVVTGFEPLDILEGVLLCVRQLEQGICLVLNQYARAVDRNGNLNAQEILELVFDIDDQAWRGVGSIAASGLRLRAEFARFDAGRRFGMAHSSGPDRSGCISGRIMQGLQKPCDCPHFGGRCRPEQPLGAPMVSSEGACAAYYRYRNRSTADAH
ncbi:hydrogenase expression/formation protein HypD [Microbulbifer donghaiensis]|uniref:Hydrogenase maturation factor n=1 Tax=Microbulbifer donghaiensis TaxID=494016 RepID=A0A1M4UQ04_9GAMM|nr:hydrogenase formation protein HypD [Microbulbifer donghaiensis]SHE58794.1 hydrogenase expression/formation protein HypD [Microbulbifer donghaiensis]